MPRIGVVLAPVAVATFLASGCGGSSPPPATTESTPTVADSGTTEAVTTTGGEAATTGGEAATTGGEAATTGGEAATTAGGEAATEIASLVEAWYARADPVVCDRMTAKLLRYGWGKAGDEGVRLCRRSLRKAEPVSDTKVKAPEVRGDRATVVVAYRLQGAGQKDEIRLVRIGGSWQLDSVSRVG